MATIAELETELAKLTLARSAILSGEAVQDVWTQGTRMRYHEVNLAALNARIAEIKNEIAAAEAAAGLTPTHVRTRSAIRISF